MNNIIKNKRTRKVLTVFQNPDNVRILFADNKLNILLPHILEPESSGGKK